MAPYGKERKIRKELLDVPRALMSDIDEKVKELMKQLESVRTATGGE